MPKSAPNQRLSQTTLWQLQSRAYQYLGIEAWTQRGVPSYLSSNPFIAKRYAQIAFTYAMEGVATGRIRRTHPLYLFELGAGTGRFTYLFLKYFLHLIQDSPLKFLRLRYVMTDLSPEVIAGWKRHPYFQRLFQSGILDCARLDLNEPASFELLSSGASIRESAARNPSIVITNYLFGYLPSDLFAIRRGQLVEGLVALDAEGINGEKAPQAEDLRCRARYRSMPDRPYYPDEHWNAALAALAGELPDTPFTFPVGALRALDFFREISPKGYCLLTADRGAVTPKQIAALQGVNVSRNALCALAINGRALLHYFRARGEMATTTNQPHPAFVLICAAAGRKGEDSAMTQRAFGHHLSDFEPADYWEWGNRIEGRRGSVTLEEIALLLKLGDWDSTNFHFFFQEIRQQLRQASDEARARWGEIVDNIFDNFFPISVEEVNLLINLGVLHFDLKNWAKALNCFQRAHLLGGAQARTYHNLNLCYQKLKDAKAAALCRKRARDLHR